MWGCFHFLSCLCWFSIVLHHCSRKTISAICLLSEHFIHNGQVLHWGVDLWASVTLSGGVWASVTLSGGVWASVTLGCGSNVDLYKKTGCNSAVLEIKRRRLRWLGHVLRMPQDSIPKVALRWTPPGKRKRGRPKMTWWQSVMAELKEMGLSWGTQQKKEPCGEALLWPYVPLGTKRISK